MPALRRLTCSLLIAAAAACSKPSADEHFKKAETLAKENHLAEAIIEYKSALQIDPRRGDIRVKLVDAYIRNQDAGNAYRESIKAADLLPNDINAQLRAGSFLLMAKQFEDAKTRADKALAIDSKNVDALLLSGNALFGLKRIEEAINEYQEAIATNPERDSPYINLGAIQYGKGDKTQAEKTFRHAIEVAPKSLAARMALANFLWASGRTAETEQAIKDGIALDPTNLDAGRILAVFYLVTNRPADAEPYFVNYAKTKGTPEAKLALADYYSVVKRTEDATAILRELAANEKTFAAANLRLATIDASNGDRAQALGKVNAVLAKQPKDSAARLLKARVLFVDNKKEEALQIATSITTDEPNAPVSADAYAVIGAAQADLHRSQEAIDAYKEVLKRQERPVGALLALATLSLSTGAIEQAKGYVNEVLTILPGNPAARALLVRIELASADASKAKGDIASLMRDYPKSAAPLNLLGNQQLREKNYEAARQSFAKAAQLEPNSFEAFAGLVTVDLQTRHVKEAVARVEAALRVANPSAGVLLIAAQTYAAAGTLDKAEDLLKRTIDLDTTNLTAYSLLGQLYIKQNRLDDAKNQFKRIADQSPKAVSAPTMLGMLSEAQGRSNEAENYYKQALKIDANAAVAANNLAWIYVAANRNLDEALQLAQAAQRVLPDQPNVNDTLGWIYYRKNLKPQAIRHLDTAVKADPTDPLSHYHLGMAYYLDGRFDKAKAELAQALKLKADFDGADEARKTLSQIGG